MKDDFTSNGRLKLSSEYNFEEESSRCDVIFDYKIYEEWFIINNNLYQCRDRNNPQSISKKRLFKIGSDEDCRSRTWDMSKSLYPTLWLLGYSSE